MAHCEQKLEVKEIPIFAPQNWQRDSNKRNRMQNDNHHISSRAIHFCVCIHMKVTHEYSYALNDAHTLNEKLMFYSITDHISFCVIR